MTRYPPTVFIRLNVRKFKVIVYLSTVSVSGLVFIIIISVRFVFGIVIFAAIAGRVRIRRIRRTRVVRIGMARMRMARTTKARIPSRYLKFLFGR